MVDHLRSDVAQMAGLFVEAILYGIYVVSLGFALVYIVWTGSPRRWRAPSGVRAVTLSVALILAVNSTLNMSWGLTRMMQIHVFNVRSERPTWIDLAKPYTVIIQTLIADLFLTYRCWAVYGNSWMMVIFPITLSVGSLAVFTWIMVIQTGMNAQFGTVSHQVKAAYTLAPLFTAQFALTTILNVYATSLIIYRIAKVDRTAERHTSTPSSSEPPEKYSKKQSQLQKVIRIIVDSAVIYTAASVITFASYKSNIQYITSAIDIMTVGIAFNMIVIRLARERSRAQQDRSNGKLSTLKFHPSPRPRASESERAVLHNTIQFLPGSELETASMVTSSGRQEEPV